MLKELKDRLKKYSENQIVFNEPHFSQQLALREGSRKEVISNLLNPDNLKYYYKENGKYGDTIYCLHFRISNTRTIRLPVIFDRGGKKNLYIITYIMRHRAWQNIIRR